MIWSYIRNWEGRGGRLPQADNVFSEMLAFDLSKTCALFLCI